MTVTPIPGVTYICDPGNAQWIAPSRPALPFAPTTPPPPPPPVDDTVYAGALPIGTSNYPIPATGVYFVAKNGRDTNTGSAIGVPFLTIQAAINKAATGTTIVARDGSYHEKLTAPSTKALTLQAYPGEAVWLDGSLVHSSWTANGDGTWTTAYANVFTRFDTTGYAGSDAFRNYPDQVWVDGTLLTQIADSSTPGAGQFSVNQTAHTLTIGTNPAGHTVAVSDLDTCLVASGRLDLLGIGVRRYSPQAMTWLNAALTFGGTSAGTIVENCVISQSHMAGVYFTRPDCTLNKCTIEDCGYDGLLATQSDGLHVTGNIFRRLNRGRWAAEPTTAAIKITRTDSSPLNAFTIADNYVTDVPGAYGIWLDVSCIRFTIANNIVDGAGLSPMIYGLEVEESDGGNIAGTQYASYVVGNKVTGCSAGGIRPLCTGWTRVWNNDVRGNNIGIYAQQDRNQNSGTQVAAGNRTTAECPWHTIHNEYVNNIFSPSSSGSYKIQFQTYDNGPKVDEGWDQIDLLDGNWFAPNPSGGSMVQLGKLGGARVTYNTLAALAASDSTVGGPPGSKLGTNYQGTATPDPAAYAVPLTAATAAALRLVEGALLIGPNLDTLPVPLS